MENITALVLGGGGSRGAYEIGVWKALNELDVHFSMVYGTSVGAINAAMISHRDCDYTAALWEELKTNNVFDVKEDSKPIDYVREIALNQGAGSKGLKELLTKYVDEDRVRKSDIHFGLTCMSVPDRTPYYLNIEDIPKGKLIDYIIASASAYPVVHSYEIDGKEYIDGGYVDAIPVKMAINKGATRVIAVDLHGFGILHKEDFKKVEDFTLISSDKNLGMQFIFDKDNTKRIMALGYIDCLKKFDKLYGKYLAFKKEDITKKEAQIMDTLGYFFELDQSIIYDKTAFLTFIRDKIKEVDMETDDIKELLDVKNLRELNNFFKDKEDDIKGFRAKRSFILTIAHALKNANEPIIPKTPGLLNLYNASKYLIDEELI